MNILDIQHAVFPEIKIIKYKRFTDDRGYFTETFRQSDFDLSKEIDFLNNASIGQINESKSTKGVIRGLHFQWNPYMGKLVRCIQGEMIDLFLDIRKGSPTFGKIGAYRMPARLDEEFGEWIWVPVGFAHGNAYTQDGMIEYICTGQYNGESEAGIGVFADDIDWSEVNAEDKNDIDSMLKNTTLSEKDQQGLTLDQWQKDTRSENFIYEK